MKKKFNQPPPPKKEISLSEMDRNRANQLELKRFELMTENAQLREQIDKWKRQGTGNGEWLDLSVLTIVPLFVVSISKSPLFLKRRK